MSREGARRFAVALLGLVLAAAALAAGPREGEPAPRARATALSGADLDTEALRGKVVLVNFWATWCTYCRSELAALDDYYAHHAAEGLAVVSINMDDDDALAQVRALAAGYRFPVALRKDASFAGYGRIWRLPLNFVIDRRGILRRDDWGGEETIGTAQLDAVLRPLLRQPP